VASQAYSLLTLSIAISQNGRLAWLGGSIEGFAIGVHNGVGSEQWSTDGFSNL